MTEKKKSTNITLENFVDKGKNRYHFMTPKKLRTIKDAKETRAAVLKKYGGDIPESIIKADFSRRQIDDIMKRDSVGTRINKYKDLGPSDKGSLKSISRFPWNVGETFLKMYTKEGDWVLDMFAGHNSRLQIVYENQRNYYGIDLCHEYMEFNKKVHQMLLQQQRFIENKSEVVLIEGDSRVVDIPQNYFDFCITSPPYWRQEHYGDEDGQMEHLHSYEEFLAELEKVVQKTFDSLKSGAFCVWCVNDFRDKQTKDVMQKFCIFHMDLITMFQMHGFWVFDIAIIDLGRSIRTCFANQFEEEKYLPKRHEYAIIARKPW